MHTWGNKVGFPVNKDTKFSLGYFYAMLKWSMNYLVFTEIWCTTWKQSHIQIKTKTFQMQPINKQSSLNKDTKFQSHPWIKTLNFNDPISHRHLIKHFERILKPEKNGLSKSIPNWEYWIGRLSRQERTWLITVSLPVLFNNPIPSATEIAHSPWRYKINSDSEDK